MVIQENETNECAMAVPVSEYPLKALSLRQAMRKQKALCALVLFKVFSQTVEQGHD